MSAMSDNKANENAQAQYKELIPGKRFAELARLIRTSNIPPADYIVRMGFQSYMEEPQAKKVKLFYVMKLKELTGIHPEKEILKAICQLSLEMDTPDVLESLVKRLEVPENVLKEMEASLQKTYVTYVEEGKFVDISKLIEITGIQPQEEIVHKGYQGYLEECKFISFSGLKKRTGIQPDEEMLQEIYHLYEGHYLLATHKKDEETAQSWINRIKKLTRISKVEPKNLAISLEEEEEE
jgi:hypothetical protein